MWFLMFGDILFWAAQSKGPLESTILGITARNDRLPRSLLEEKREEGVGESPLICFLYTSKFCLF
jgi:hypothetical protein